MTKIYVAAPGRSIPNGWPADGRPINDLSAHERMLVKSGDLIEAPTTPAKKDKTHGQ